MKVFAITLLGLPLIQFEWGHVDDKEEPRDHVGGSHDFGFHVASREPPIPSLDTFE